MRADLITLSLELAAERCEDITPLVYARLFEQRPEMEALFWSDKTWAVRGEMLSKVIEAILDFVGERLYADHLIQTEVVNHAGVDVAPGEFGLFFGVVAETLKDLVGEGWTPDIDAAWSSLLAELAWYVDNPAQTARLQA